MQPNPLVFRDLAYVFVAAVLGGAAAWRLRQPLILGYVVAGILIGPFTPGPSVSDVHVFELFAEIGVVLLMFSVGIEFSLGLLGTILGLVVGGKLVIWTLVVWAFRFPLATAVRVGVGLTQIGEFSFILVQVARTAGHVGDEVYAATLAASLVTILVNAMLVRELPGWLPGPRLEGAK